MVAYCLDTSSLLETWVRNYPFDIAGSLWEWLDQRAAKGQLRAPEEVLHEIKKQDDGLCEWCRQREYLFAAIDEAVQQEVRGVLKQFPGLIAITKSRSMADPWVIAHALVSDSTVVTEEARSDPRKPAKHPKIPDVCDAPGIPCVNFVGLLRQERVRLQIQ